MNEIEKLKLENELLRKKLVAAKGWMEKEVKMQMKEIYKKEIDNSGTISSEDLEEEITKKIRKFFGEMAIMNMPQNIIENIISAEINYHNMQSNHSIDGLSIITSYHKALDSMIEAFISKGYRKFAIKQKCTVLRKNDPLEKAFLLVVKKGYILSIGRLFHIIELIKEDNILYDFGKCFSKYLDKYYYLKDVLLDDNFFEMFKKITSSEILGKKRHSGMINFKETKKARELIIGNLEDKNCLLYRLIETQNIDF